MHTYHAEFGTAFVHHGDYTGDVEICLPEQTIKIPFADLKEFIADYARNQRIEKLERASSDEILT